LSADATSLNHTTGQQLFKRGVCDLETQLFSFLKTRDANERAALEFHALTLLDALALRPIQLLMLLKILRHPTTGFALLGAHQVGAFQKKMTACLLHSLLHSMWLGELLVSSKTYG
ncbi:hypothetical protein CSKR_102487, partial [Clonorchis sinensis]